ncbi:MAG: M48 family metallopeptidase [Actinomycetota bacterium]
MTMDFQTRQDEARQNTTRLVVLLAAGVIAIIAVVSVLITGLLWYGSGEFQPLAALAVAAPITTIGIVGTSLVKSSQIRSGGGSYVAASMGGRPVDFNTLDPAEKQLANVVEEIAIASGMPVPALYVLDNEPGINAFAAGWSADNAAIGVTRGALEHFTRRELQGVVAHEFSHIANGDTRIYTRIIGWVFGIAAITVLGRILLQNLWWAPRRRDNRDNSIMIVLAAAIGLIVIGALGTLFARMVQAAVSRQREYLADASAVQYTRDPSGIGEALMKIAAHSEQGSIRSAHATETSHLFISKAMNSSFATHPPLEDRIRRLLPDWDGSLPELTEAQPPAPQAGARAGNGQGRQAGRPGGRGGPGGRPGPVMIPGMPGIGIPGMGGMPGAAGLAGAAPGGRPSDAAVAAAVASASERPAQPHFGGPTDAHVEHARGLLARIPEPTQAFLHTRQGAAAAVVGLAVSPDAAERPRQLDLAGRSLGLEAGYVEAAGRVISDLHRSLQLPAIDIALHSIRELPWEHKARLLDLLRALEDDTHHQDLFRWMLRRVVVRHIEDQHEDGSRREDARLGSLEGDARTLYGVIAHFNSSGADQAQAAFEAALTTAGLPPGPIAPIQELTFDRLDSSLGRLGEMVRSDRQRFVSGATAAVLHDGRTTVEEAELIRVVADAVRQPVPPLIST